MDGRAANATAVETSTTWLMAGEAKPIFSTVPPSRFSSTA